MLALDDVTGSERRRLRLAMLANVSGSLLIVLLIGGMIWARSLRASGALDQGQLFLMFPVGLFWLWLLRKSPGQLLRLRSDIHSGSVDMVQGLCHIETHRGIGLLAPVRQYAIINERRFAADGLEGIDRFRSANVKARVGKASGLLLSLARTEPEEDNPSDLLRLSASDLERLALMSQGLSDKEIARKLDLSPSTIRTYNTATFRKLGASGRKEAVEIAIKRRLVDVDQHQSTS